MLALDTSFPYIIKDTTPLDVIFVENVWFACKFCYFSMKKSLSDVILVENNSLNMHIFLFQERDKSSKCDICGKC